MNEKIDRAQLKAKKKGVSWNDGQIEGKIGESFLKVDPSASVTKETLEDEISELMKSGFSEIEASSMVGKAQTPSGKVLITEPVFYDSRDQIIDRKFLETQAKSLNGTSSAAKNPSPENGAANRYSFFSTTVIGVGVALAFAATIGFGRNN